ncbi:hypothetical protein A3J13_00995 [Candidatus Daviesbacteria bacterium RIFCSPLOWO2_02_FULL_36_8]|uniref:glucose-6-phosphate isomerase n=1 Tax=Candidatus Daviesbacteria bacterium RIFCSPLOWO2_02_FULL_36_8 TaxID=1797793 RepID=A0A1F5MFR0_9BACT|nr:MAG: hypothetical protein A3J13_00995 [Candidatus Daviesbacteria bacterium RIFCSPLOWO2_02_FULL_36_8]
MVTEKTKEDLKQVLMDQTKDPYSKKSSAYYVIEDNDQQIFIVAPGKNGSEFNKTVGYFSSYPGMQTYQCLYGQGVFLIQRNDDEGEAKEFKIISLHPGRQVLVPAGWGICIVNSGNTLLVVLRNSLLDEKHKDSEPVLEKHGLAYYIVEKKGEISFDENPNYRLHPQISTE